MRAFDTVYAIDGQPLLVPDAGVELNASDLDSGAAGRDEAGYMHRIPLRHSVRTWGFTYSHLDARELAYLRGLLEGKTTVRFTWEEGTVEAYCAKQEVRLWDRSRGLYQGLRFTVIQC